MYTGMEAAQVYNYANAGGGYYTVELFACTDGYPQNNTTNCTYHSGRITISAPPQTGPVPIAGDDISGGPYRGVAGQPVQFAAKYDSLKKSYRGFWRWRNRNY